MPYGARVFASLPTFAENWEAAPGPAIRADMKKTCAVKQNLAAK
jgi:hypothetical protein